MKKLLFALLLASATMTAQTTVTLKDGVYKVQTKDKTFKTPKDTGKIFQDSKGNKYPILQSDSGAYFVIRTSAKSGKTYKQYISIQ